MIAAVTNFYNPGNNAVKLDNFERMRAGLRGLPLYVVEAVFGNQSFQLDDSIRVRCRDVIWQQYRLICHGIRCLPDKFDKAVWVDADILFSDDNWHERMSEMLDRYKVVQSYGEVELVGKGGTPGQVKDSVTKEALKNALKPTATSLSGNLDLSAIFATGFSWGVRRDLVERHGVYDRWITGSDDIAWVIGIWGDWKNDFLCSRLNPKMREHYMDWAKPFNHDVGGSVSYLDAKITHLWHGHRNYRKRWKCLKDYDPASDVAVVDGALVWNSDKPDLHNCCARMCANYDIEFKPFL